MFSPVLALGVAGVVALFAARAARMRREAWLVTAVCVLMFLFLAGMSNWRAGWCVGPRYIATVAPFLILPLLKLWPRVGGTWWATAIATGLLIPSVLLNVVSGALYPHYPEAFDNPVFDLAFPLIGAGVRAVRARPAAAPAGVVGAGAARAVVLAALALVAAGDDPRPRRVAGHVALTLASRRRFCSCPVGYGRQAARPTRRAQRQAVRQLWEPRRL